MGTRERIIEAALVLLSDGGPAAMSTRAVSAAAGVQAPTIYRLFVDKDGLLDAVTAHRFEGYLVEKTTRERAEDPVEDLRRGWDVHVGFGLENPAVYAAVYGGMRLGHRPVAAARADQILLEMMHRIAAAGRLRLDVPTAARMVHAAGLGVTLALINTSEAERDLHLSELAREAVIAAVTTDDVVRADDPVAVAARTLHAALPASGGLTDAERHLMAEWLGRFEAPR